MFEDLFLPAIERECSHMDRSIYHLDGPGALRHLDRLLDIPSIHAIQWVPGAGREYWGQWLEIYKKVQEKGRAFTINIRARELEEVAQAIRPEGAWLIIDELVTEDEADHLLRTVSRWGVTNGA